MLLLYPAVTHTHANTHKAFLCVVYDLSTKMEPIHFVRKDFSDSGDGKCFCENVYLKMFRS